MIERIRTLRYPLEAIIWVVGIAAVAVPNPAIEGSFTLCIFDLIGFQHCPGCGLGHAMGYLFRGDVAKSMESHLLAIPVLVILGVHVTELMIKALRAKQNR